jgi:hypothetical protein
MACIMDDHLLMGLFEVAAAVAVVDEVEVVEDF